MKTNKRSQIEIVGLLIIIILVSLILLFVLRAILTPDDSTRETVSKAQLASSMIGAIVKTSSRCTDESEIKDLLIDCAKSPETGGTIRCSDGRYSCKYANETINEMLDSTLGEWKKTYEFIVTSPSGKRIVYAKGGDLSKSRGGETAMQPLSVPPSYDTLEIKLCMGGCS